MNEKIYNNAKKSVVLCPLAKHCYGCCYTEVE